MPQASILPLGYQLHDSACERVGDVVARSVRRFREKVQSSTNGLKLCFTAGVPGYILKANDFHTK